jgi:hypothetical protein
LQVPTSGTSPSSTFQKQYSPSPQQIGLPFGVIHIARPFGQQPCGVHVSPFAQHSLPPQHVSPFSQQSGPHFFSLLSQTQVAFFTFSALHFCFGPQHAVVVLLAQQFVPLAQQITAPFFAGWQLCPPYFSHGWHSPSTQSWYVGQHVFPQETGPSTPPPNWYW